MRLVVCGGACQWIDRHGHGVACSWRGRGVVVAGRRSPDWRARSRARLRRGRRCNEDEDVDKEEDEDEDKEEDENKENRREREQDSRRQTSETRTTRTKSTELCEDEKAKHFLVACSMASQRAAISHSDAWAVLNRPFPLTATARTGQQLDSTRLGSSPLHYTPRALIGPARPARPARPAGLTL